MKKIFVLLICFLLIGCLDDPFGWDEYARAEQERKEYALEHCNGSIQAKSYGCPTKFGDPGFCVGYICKEVVASGT
jgi:hypothetical protein